MKVPFLEVRGVAPDLDGELSAAWQRVLESGSYILGEELAAFEREWATYCGARHCVGTANGLDALHLILRAYGIGRGDEVVVPAMTFIATWLAVSLVGARPVGVDIDAATGNLDPARLEAALGAKTRAVVVVHLCGLPADMTPIRALCTARGIPLIEDAAQAHGASLHGRRAGSLSDAAAFSFYPSKNLGALGDAGAVTTSDDRLDRQLRLLRNYGSVVKYQHEVPGVNSRLDPLQAAFLRVKLRQLDGWNRLRAEQAARYRSALAGIVGLALPRSESQVESAWHLFVVRHDRRDDLQAHLQAHEIGTLIHYPTPPHLAAAFADAGGRAGDFPEAERWARTALSLPLGPHLTSAQQDWVIDALHRWR